MFYDPPFLYIIAFMENEVSIAAYRLGAKFVKSLS